MRQTDSAREYDVYEVRKMGQVAHQACTHLSPVSVA